MVFRPFYFGERRKLFSNWDDYFVLPSIPSNLLSKEMEWHQTPDSYVCTAALPGVEREDLEIEVTGERTVRISGAKTSRIGSIRDGGKKRKLFAERSFLRQFELPSDANISATSARLFRGILTVIIPKGVDEEEEDNYSAEEMHDFDETEDTDDVDEEIYSIDGSEEEESET